MPGPMHTAYCTTPMGDAYCTTPSAHHTATRTQGVGDAEMSGVLALAVLIALAARWRIRRQA